MNAIDALSSQHSISILCRVLNVNRSTYYKHLRHQPSRRKQENMEIRKRILELYAQSDKRLGVKKMKLCLERDYCINISVGRVYRLMKTMALPKMSTVHAMRIPAFAKIFSTRDLTRKPPNLVWVGDFTYVRVGARFYYICAILDLFTRKIIACRVGPNIDRFPAIATLRDAVKLRGVSKGVMFHSDQGSQFTSKDFRMVIDELGMVQSFSAKGHPYDNSCYGVLFQVPEKRRIGPQTFLLSPAA